MTVSRESNTFTKKISNKKSGFLEWEIEIEIAVGVAGFFFGTLKLVGEVRGRRTDNDINLQ